MRPKFVVERSSRFCNSPINVIDYYNRERGKLRRIETECVYKHCMLPNQSASCGCKGSLVSGIKILVKQSSSRLTQCNVLLDIKDGNNNPTSFQILLDKRMTFHHFLKEIIFKISEIFPLINTSELRNCKVQSKIEEYVDI